MRTLSTILVLLLLLGCSDSKPENNDEAVAFENGRFKRLNIDGVDCIVAASRYDAAVAITCDWANKREVLGK